MKSKKKCHSKKHEYVYMVVTADEYELPLAVFDHLTEVGEYACRTPESINTSICRGNKDTALNVKYIRIDIKEQENDWQQSTDNSMVIREERP